MTTCYYKAEIGYQDEDDNTVTSAIHYFKADWGTEKIFEWLGHNYNNPWHQILVTDFFIKYLNPTTQISKQQFKTEVLDIKMCEHLS